MAIDTTADAAQRLDEQAWDFRPDLLTIQRSPPSAWPRGVMLAIVALLALLMLWATLARLDIVVTAQGRLVPMSFTKVVQPAESGVVVELHVREGEVVSAGQLLLKLDARVSATEREALARDVAIKRLTLQRIEAERWDRPFVPPADAPIDIAQLVGAQHRARRESLRDALAQETSAQNKARADLASAQQMLSKLQQTLPLVRQSAQAHEALLKDGFIGEVAANEKRREWLEREQDLKAQEAVVQGLLELIDGSDKRKAALRSRYRSELENERLDTLTLLNKSTQELDKSTLKGEALAVRAPTDGVVKDLAVHAPGMVVAAGGVLMNIVPRGEPVQAEVVLANQDMGFVAEGQPVQVKVAAYPFQKHGLVEGTVALLSPDSADQRQQQQTGQPTLSYRALITLAQQSLTSPQGRPLHLQPGMLVTAEIHQGRRTVLEYLLSPVQKTVAEAARER